MGKLIEGKWHTDEDISRVNQSGEYKREDSVLRNWLQKNGFFKPESGRYHVYLAYNCPWAHRVLIYLKVKKLEEVISTSFVAPKRTDQGWVFTDEYHDDLYQADSLHEIYTRGEETYTGRVTVPVLWDKINQKVVSNESAEIIRMLDLEFDEFSQSPIFYSSELSDEIDQWNDLIYQNLNNGVYRAGFAEKQESYNTAVEDVFTTLEKIEKQLEKTRYLAGDQLTEADWRLFPTLARFDVAYYGAFKCNLKRIQDFPNLWNYTKELFQYPGIAETVKLDIYRNGYFSKSKKRNPLGIIPIGPNVDFSGPHNR